VIPTENSDQAVRMEYDLSGLPDGNYSFTAQAVDASGSKISASSAPLTVSLSQTPATPELALE